jgi:hypothetical protein
MKRGVFAADWDLLPLKAIYYLRGTRSKYFVIRWFIRSLLSLKFNVEGNIILLNFEKISLCKPRPD